MAGFSRFRTGLRRSASNDRVEDDNTTEITPVQDAAVANQAPDDPEADKKSSLELPDENAQRGVQDVEAVALAWSKKSLVTIFGLMWMLYLVNGFQSSVVYNLIPYVTSDWDSHSLLTVIYIVANAISAAVYIPLAKLLDVWGRAEGFLVMTTLATIGLILMATCQSLPMFSAAYVFYVVGFGGMTYCIDVITADVSKLKNRGLAYAFTSSPYMITAFAGAKASEGFYNNVSWRWAFGCFAIIFPVVAAPLFILLKYNLRKAANRGLVGREKSGRTAKQSIWFYVKQFDALGVFLFASGLTVFLLPFTLADSAPNGWSTSYIIAMIVVGFLTLVAFGLYEAFMAPVPFVNYSVLTDRTVIGACILDATYQVSYYCWSTYFSSFLQVVNNLTLAQAGYVGNTFDVVSGVLLLAVGFSISKTGRFKWLLYGAVPLYIFAQGLLIYFRRPNGYIGYIIMCQVFISVGGAIFILVEQVAVLAALDHQHIAAGVAILYVVGNTGGAIGNTISGAIWTNTFRKALERNLPESALPDLDSIYGDLEVQLSYEVGSPERLAIQESYGYAQTRMLAAGTGIMCICFISLLLIRNINVAKIQQVKGMVF